MKRILLIGTGGIAGAHAGTLAKLRGAKIAAVCDIDRPKAVDFAARHKLDVPAFADAAEAMDKASCDYVLLCTPSRVRKPIIQLCANRKLPIIFEKPPCHDEAAGRAIQRMLTRSRLIHSVALPLRYVPAVDKVMQLIQGHRLSLVSMVYLSTMAVVPNYKKYAAYYLIEKTGGLVVDQAIHCIDLARYLTGAEAVQIAAAGANRLLKRSRRVTTVDVAGWTMVMDNNVVVTHAHTWGSPRWDFTVRIVTDRADLTVRPPQNELSGQVDGRKVRWTPPADRPVFSGEHKAFLKAVTTRSMKPIRTPFADSFKSFQLSQKILKLIHGRANVK